jgi:Tat protein secretion system quality control protein TatD with DNase activity
MTVNSTTAGLVLTDQAGLFFREPMTYDVAMVENSTEQMAYPSHSQARVMAELGLDFTVANCVESEMQTRSFSQAVSCEILELEDDFDDL